MTTKNQNVFFCPKGDQLKENKPKRLQLLCYSTSARKSGQRLQRFQSLILKVMIMTLRAVLVPENVTPKARNVEITIVLRSCYWPAFTTRKLEYFQYFFQIRIVPYFHLNIYTYDNKKLFFSLPNIFLWSLVLHDWS